VDLPEPGARTLRVRVARGTTTAPVARVPVAVDHAGVEGKPVETDGAILDRHVSFVNSHMIEGARVRVCNLEEAPGWVATDPRGAVLEVLDRQGGSGDILLPADRRLTALVLVLGTGVGAPRRQYPVRYAGPPSAATKTWSDRMETLLQRAASSTDRMAYLKGAALAPGEHGNAPHRVALPWARDGSRYQSFEDGFSVTFEVDAERPILCDALAHVAAKLQAARGLEGWSFESFAGGNACAVGQNTLSLLAADGRSQLNLIVFRSGFSVGIWEHH
jgi:hypothetical protein